MGTGNGAMGPREPKTPPPKAIPKEPSTPPPKAVPKEPAAPPPKTAAGPKQPEGPPPKAPLTGTPAQTGNVKVEQMRVETGQCPVCFAETIRGRISCDSCGHILDAKKADRTKIAERRKEQLRKLGLKYDFKGDFLQQITEDQLTGLGLLDELQFRGNISPEADLLARARSRYQRAEKLGYASVLARFTADTTFAQSLLAEGDTEYDCEWYDVLRFAHLPRTERTSAQIRLGVSDNSQMEHTAMRLVFIDVEGKQDIPDRFHYLGKQWLFMYRTEIYIFTGRVCGLLGTKSYSQYFDVQHGNGSH